MNKANQIPTNSNWEMDDEGEEIRRHQFVGGLGKSLKSLIHHGFLDTCYDKRNYTWLETQNVQGVSKNVQIFWRTFKILASANLNPTKSITSYKYAKGFVCEWQKIRGKYIF